MSAYHIPCGFYFHIFALDFKASNTYCLVLAVGINTASDKYYSKSGTMTQPPQDEAVEFLDSLQKAESGSKPTPTKSAYF